MTTQETEYTSLDFLSKIRPQPKKNLFKQLTLNTDLEEINQVLSPKAKVQPLPSNTIDKQLAKRFVLELVTRYQNQIQANAKWQAFMKSIESQSFEVFISSLKDIKQQKKEPPTNPQNDSTKEQINAKTSRYNRSSSTKKIQPKRQIKESSNNNKNKQRIKEEVCILKDLLLAGQRFIRQKINQYQ